VQISGAGSGDRIRLDVTFASVQLWTKIIILILAPLFFGSVDLFWVTVWATLLSISVVCGYGNLLRDLIGKHDVDCWLVNTGWTGGKYGTGRRVPIKVTRALLSAALNGSLRNADFRTDRYFGFAVPTSLPGVEPHILDPIKTWGDKAEFDKTARALVGMFQKNFAKFEAQVDADVRAAAPDLKLSAE
jgi:ATP-dependent phosphoenolpyruvate carboxykinase